MAENIKNKTVEPLTAEEINTLTLFYSAFTNKNPEIADEVLSPDWQDIPLPPGQVEGAQGYKDLIKYFTSAFPDVAVTVHEIFGTHERAGVRAEMSFTHSSEFFGITPTHEKVTIALHEFHHLKNNKLVKTWHLEDWMSMLMQIGAKINKEQ